jgi:hypothetical protein
LEEKQIGGKAGIQKARKQANVLTVSLTIQLARKLARHFSCFFPCQILG